MAPVKERIRSFERKYGCNITAFENKLRQLPEDFELWDDLIEWKAYTDSLKDLESKLEKNEDATNFRAPKMQKESWLHLYRASIHLLLMKQNSILYCITLKSGLERTLF